MLGRIEERFNGVELRVDGVVYPWWTGFSFKSSVDDLCTEAQMSVTVDDRGYADYITKNSKVELWLRDVTAVIESAQDIRKAELIATCRIDKDSRSMSASDHSIDLSMRSLGRELVDCQISGSHNGLKLAEIIKRLCAKFKIPFTSKAETQLVKQFSMQSESPYNNIAQLVRAANLLLYPTPDGGITLVEPDKGAVVETFIFGQDFTSYKWNRDYQMMFSSYSVKSHASMREEAKAGKQTDESFKFYRPFETVADKQGSEGGCERRAKLEFYRRKARSEQLELTLPGWFRQDGKVRTLNTQVRVVIPHEGVDSTFLVGDLELRLSDKGSESVLGLQHRNAYSGMEPPSKRRSTRTRPKKYKSRKRVNGRWVYKY